MIHKPCLTILFLSVLPIATAQEKNITLEDIWNGSFKTERMEVLHSMDNGQYSVLNFN